MNVMWDHHIPAAEFFVRTFLGILFFFQGYDKLFGIKMQGVIGAFQTDANTYHIPRPILVLIAYYTSIVEFTGGLLLIFGLFSSYALCFLGFDLLIVGFAFSYIQPMWNMKYVFPRLVMLIFLLMLPENAQQFSLDHYFMNR